MEYSAIFQDNLKYYILFLYDGSPKNFIIFSVFIFCKINLNFKIKMLNEFFKLFFFIRYEDIIKILNN